MSERYQPRIGSEFDVDAIKLGPEVDYPSVVREHTRQETARTRNRIAYGILLGMGAVLTGAASMRFIDGSFGALHAAWDVLTVPFGIVLGFYFNREG